MVIGPGHRLDSHRPNRRTKH